MRNSFLLFLLLEFSIVCKGQNLVPNPSFEDTIACPNNLTQISNASGWFGCNLTPDYFNACASPFAIPSVSCPSNQWGYQLPHSGNAYAGISTYNTGASNSREIIGILMSQPMVIGIKYSVSFYVSRAVSNSCDLSTNNIGVLFSSVAYSSSNPIPINNFSHVHADSIIDDSASWYMISGSFIADSAYTYLYLGNLYSDSLTNYIHYNSGTALYYVDDVEVVEDTAITEGVFNPTRLNNLTVEINSIIKYSINHLDNSKIYLVNLLGKIIMQIPFDQVGNDKIYINGILPGLYFFIQRNQTKEIISKIFIE
jgi:hypothetical protein